MSHRMRDTSLLAYHALDDLGERQLKVLSAIRQMNSRSKYPTDREVARYLGYADPNNVRPRRKELADSGKVVPYEKRLCTVSGRLAWTWRASPSWEEIEEVKRSITWRTVK